MFSIETHNHMSMTMQRHRSSEMLMTHQTGYDKGGVELVELYICMYILIAVSLLLIWIHFNPNVDK